MDTAICYVADLGFMLPTLVSATQVRRFIPPDQADIFIFAILPDDADIEPIRARVGPNGIQIIRLDPGVFAGLDWTRANNTHVPVAALGRFFLTDLLPANCRQIVYLDGDTWMNRSPASLVGARVPEGRLAAVDDISYFCRNDLTSHGRFVRSYFNGIGIDGARGYFNSGVFAVARNTFRTVAAEALEFFKTHTQACKYHDQSAMNAVIGDRRIRMSLGWNFTTPFRYWNVEAQVDPVIYHFASGLKPWTGPIHPWADMFPRYLAENAAFASLALPSKRFDEAEIAATNRFSHRQQNKLRLFPWRLWQRRRIAHELTASAFP